MFYYPSWVPGVALEWGGPVVVRAGLLCSFGSYLLSDSVLSAIMGSRVMVCGVFAWVVMRLTAIRLDRVCCDAECEIRLVSSLSRFGCVEGVGS